MKRISCWALIFPLLCGCDAAAREVRVQPLPPLSESDGAARAGLAEVAGEWHFRGVELGQADTALAERAANSQAVLTVQTQRLDSLAATFVASGVRLPLVGEIRRDGVVSLAGLGPAGESVVLAGRLLQDTLWVELLLPREAAPWPRNARAALVRGTPGPRFARLAGGGNLFREGLLPPVDSLRAGATTDSAPPVGARPAPDTFRPAAPEESVAPMPPRPEPSRPPTPAPREEPRLPTVEVPDTLPIRPRPTIPDSGAPPIRPPA